MQDTLFRYNEVLKAEPLPGKMLATFYMYKHAFFEFLDNNPVFSCDFIWLGRVFNVQSLDVRFREKAQPGFEKFNENYFTWVREKGDSPDYFFLHFLRVYYDESMNESTAAISQIGKQWKHMPMTCTLPRPISIKVIYYWRFQRFCSKAVWWCQVSKRLWIFEDSKP